MEITSRIIAAAQDAADMRRGMGAAALETDAASDGSVQARRRATVAAFGTNMMDLSTRPPAARAGYEQGRGLAGDLIRFWC